MKKLDIFNNPKPKKVPGKISPFSYPIISTEILPIPSSSPETSFVETLANRRSERNLRKLRKDQLCDLLYYSAKNVKVNSSTSNDIWFQRPTPSAGGIHPIDIIVCAPEKIGYSFNYYNPIDHSLNRLNLDGKEKVKFIKQVNTIIDLQAKPTILWLVAHEYRTAAKYKNPTSLVWRDAGCLLFCLQLTCTALKINSCLLGILGEPNISQLFRKFGKVYGVGGCVVGD